MAKADRLNNFESMCCAKNGKAVMDFKRIYKAEKSARACILNLFSLVASLLAAEQKNLSQKSKHCTSVRRRVAMTGSDWPGPVSVSCAAFASFFLAALLDHG